MAIRLRVLNIIILPNGNGLLEKFESLSFKLNFRRKNLLNEIGGITLREMN